MNEVSDGFDVVSSPLDGLMGQMAILFGVLFLLVVVVAVLRRDAGIIKGFVVITLFGAVLGGVVLMFGAAQQEQKIGEYLPPNTAKSLRSGRSEHNRLRSFTHRQGRDVLWLYIKPDRLPVRRRRDLLENY